MKRLHISFFCLFMLLTYSIQLKGQENKDTIPRYYLHSLADTSINPSYIPYIEFWINYLYTYNDSVRRTYWNPEDIKRWGNNYALFYGAIFQHYPSKLLLNYLKPYILSVHCKDNFCRIATAFWNFNYKLSTNTKTNYNPYAISEIGIYKKNGQMYLTNLFDQRTSGWQKFSSNKINYIVEPTLQLDNEQIKKASGFVDSLSRLFDTEFDSITYVVCNSPNELGYIIGFNFFYSGFANGRAFHDGRMLLSGLGTFNYPHELAHFIIDPFFKSGIFFGEGMTTYFGGSKNKSFNQLLPEFKEKYPEITDSVFTKIIKYPNSKSAYILGALVVEYIYKEKGISGLKSLSETPVDTIEFISYICEKFGINKETLFQKINLRLNLINNQ